MRAIPLRLCVFVSIVALSACQGDDGGAASAPASSTPSSTGDTAPTGTPSPTGAATAHTGTAATEGTLSALTYNVHGLPDVITGDDGNARMQAISPLLDRFDIVGLQETFDPDKHALLTADAHHQVQTWFDDKVEDSRVYGSGLAVLARAELVEVFTEHYRQCNGLLDDSSDCLASKGFQVVRLRLGGPGGAELDVYNTHHEAGGSEDDELARSDQVSQVLESIAGRSAGRAILYLGDTNLRPSDPPDAVELQRYAEAGLRDACLEVACPETDHIDRFLLRDSDALALQVTAWANEAAFFDADGVPLSDHPAISTELSWSLR